ncbi:hypothetical protein V5O48_000329 [Marasmius crinis-equi]|uniref:Uncharacterized protein n=1 Tax=Marasmius crinis-equi TaxID=585013 RepID=A0ABR3G1M7_9AGAR
MTQAAATELHELSLKHQVLQFYAPPASTRNNFSIQAPEKGYSAESYYSSFREKPAWPTFAGSPPKLDKLMLYRHPPPPDELNSVKVPLPITKKDQAGDTAKAVLSRDRLNRLAAGNQQSQKRRRISCETDTFGCGTVENSPAPQTGIKNAGVQELPGRNPFRRTVKDGIPSSRDAVTGSMSQANAETDGICRPFTIGKDVASASPRLGTAASDHKGAFPNQKPLKPISTIPIPSLPPDEQRKLKESATREEAMTKKRTSRHSVPGSGESQDIRQMLKRMSSAGSMKTKTPVASAVSKGQNGGSFSSK